MNISNKFTYFSSILWLHLATRNWYRPNTMRWTWGFIYPKKYNWAVTWDFQQCGMCDQQRLRPACAYAQTDQSICQSLKYSMSVKLPTIHHLEFLSLKGGCTGSSESTLVNLPHCWKLRVAAHVHQDRKAKKNEQKTYNVCLNSFQSL